MARRLTREERLSRAAKVYQCIKENPGIRPSGIEQELGLGKNIIYLLLPSAYFQEYPHFLAENAYGGLYVFDSHITNYTK